MADDPAKKLAWSLNLVSYEHGVRKRSCNQSLNVRATTIVDLNDGEYWAPRKTPTEEELGPSTPDTKHGIWVGMRPRAVRDLALEAKDVDNRFAKRKIDTVMADEGAPKMQSTRGQCVASIGSDAYALPYDPRALRVVVLANANPTRYHVLINPKDGLCEAAVTSIDEVFFFSEYRDDSNTSHMLRKSAWATKVRDAVSSTQSSSISHSDPLSARVHPSLPREPARLSTLGKMPGDIVTSECATQTSKPTEPEPENASVRRQVTANHNILLQLVDHGGPVIVVADAKKALRALLQLRPALADYNITTTELVALSKAVATASLVVPLDLAPSFILQFVLYKLRAGGVSGASAVAAAKDVYKTVFDTQGVTSGGKLESPRTEINAGHSQAKDSQVVFPQGILHYLRDSMHGLSEVSPHESTIMSLAQTKQMLREAKDEQGRERGIDGVVSFVASQLGQCLGRLHNVIEAKIATVERVQPDVDSKTHVRSPSSPKSVSEPQTEQELVTDHE